MAIDTSLIFSFWRVDGILLINLRIFLYAGTIILVIALFFPMCKTGYMHSFHLVIIISFIDSVADIINSSFFVIIILLHFLISNFIFLFHPVFMFFFLHKIFLEILEMIEYSDFFKMKNYECKYIIL